MKPWNVSNVCTKSNAEKSEEYRQESMEKYEKSYKIRCFKVSRD